MHSEPEGGSLRRLRATGLTAVAGGAVGSLALMFHARALYVVMLVIALGSLAIYADDARGHRRPQAAFVYVAVPPASWLLLGVVVPIAAVMARRRTRRE